MNKKLFISIGSAILGISMLSGCSSLHVHDYNAQYGYNETEHWQICDKCNNKFNEDVHAFNSYNDTCLICNYADPTFIINEEGIMTGLTAHGKSKYEIDIPTNVKFIGKDALKDSKVTRVNIPKELIGYYEGAFDTNKVNIRTDEEKVIWTYVDGIYYKHNVLEEYEAMIGDNVYVTLQEAFNSVKEDETTIVLTKQDITLSTPLYVDRIVNVESYYENTNLNCDFNISGSGILNIKESVTFKGNAKLILADKYELLSDYSERVLTSGTIAFIGKENRPEGVYVEYVRSFSGENGYGYEAVGSKQVVNDVLVIPVIQYAYGSFSFSSDFKSIKGLSAYGQGISELHITNIVKNVDAVIGAYAFAVYTDIKINIAVISDTHITYYQTKGSFTSVYVDSGITRIEHHAFTNETTEDIFHEVKKMIAILCRIQTVYIGDSVTYIGVSAFAQSLSIMEVYGGKGLVTIDRYAFYENINLKGAYFDEAYSLTSIKAHAFSYCDNFISLSIPADGWSIKGQSFLPHEFTPDVAAYHAVHQNPGDDWSRSLKGSIFFTKSLAKDGCNRYNNIGYTDVLTYAIISVCSGGWIYISNKISEEQKHIDALDISKDVNIETYPGLDNVTMGTQDLGLTVESNHFISLNGIKPLGKVILKATDSTNYLEYPGCFAYKSNNSEDYQSINVYYQKTSNEELLHARLSPATFAEGIEYMTAGLFGFIFRNNNTGILLTDNAAYAKKTVKLHIDNPLADDVDEKYKCKDIDISNNMFKNDTTLRYLTFADCVIGIGLESFQGCSNLESVTFGTGFADMLESAFKDCVKLKRVDFGEGNKFWSMGANSFQNCNALEWFNFGGSLADWKVSTDPVTTIPTSDLNDPSSAAQQIKKFVSYRWYRY